MKRIISSVVNIIISAFLLTAIHTFWHPCEGAMAMACTYSTRTATVLLILAVIINAGKLFVSDVKGRLVLSVTTVAVGIFLTLIPQLGRCQVASMSCNAKTFPALCVGALLIIAQTVIFESADLLGNRRKRHAFSK